MLTDPQEFPATALLPATTLLHGITLAELTPGDAPALAAAYRRNRDYLAPWEPLREDSFFTAAGQEAVIASKLALQETGSEVPMVLSDGERMIGTITLTGIVRGPFLSANLGYWVDQEYAGRGIGTSAVAAVVEIARERLSLHRIQAVTLLHNAGSQRILQRSGFERIGLAPRYLKIAGRWQDHLMFQRVLEDPR